MTGRFDEAGSCGDRCGLRRTVGGGVAVECAGAPQRGQETVAGSAPASASGGVHSGPLAQNSTRVINCTFSCGDPRSGARAAAGPFGGRIATCDRFRTLSSGGNGPPTTTTLVRFPAGP